MGTHSIIFLGDHEMPKGHDFVLIDMPCGAVILYRESAVTPETLEASWAAYRALGGRNLPKSPTRMVDPLLLTA